MKSNRENYKDITIMNTSKSQRAWAVVFGVAMAVMGCAEGSKEAPPVPKTAATAAPQSLPMGVVGANLVSATARVKALDQQTRMVTLERSDGSEVTFHADATVRNLAQVAVGDEVTATYYESLAYEVKKPGAATAGATVAGETARARLGEKPAGADARAVTIVATIANIDKAAGTVTLRGPTGRAMTIKARDPRNLDRVAVGDLVEITYTEAIAVLVEKSSKP